METIHQFKIIDGDFSASEARQVLMNMLSSKISFHSMEIFSIQERFNGDVSRSVKRIRELKAIGDSLNTIFDDTAAKGMKLRIKGSIELRLVGESMDVQQGVK